MRLGIVGGRRGVLGGLRVNVRWRPGAGNVSCERRKGSRENLIRRSRTLISAQPKPAKPSCACVSLRHLQPEPIDSYTFPGKEAAVVAWRAAGS